MTTEQRLDRLERVATLFVTAGLRARANAREQDQKIKILMDAQARNEKLFANLARSLDKLEQAQIRRDQRLDGLS